MQINGYSSQTPHISVFGVKHVQQYSPIKIQNNSECNVREIEVLKKQLSDSDFFKKLYEPDNHKNFQQRFIAKLLENPVVAKEVFKDKNVMRASTEALLDLTQKQLNSAIKNNNTQKAEKLSLTYGLLSASLKTLNSSEKQIVLNNEKQYKNVAFAGLFNFGFFDDPRSKKERAEIIVNRWSTGAAGTAALLANTGIGDKIALTYITKELCKRVFRVYKLSGGYVAAITGVACGAVLGTEAAATALTIWPGAGNAANATITYALHQMTGRACIAFCEDVGYNPNLTDVDAVAKFGVRLKNFLNVIKNDKIRSLASAAIDKALDVVL